MKATMCIIFIKNSLNIFLFLFNMITTPFALKHFKNIETVVCEKKSIKKFLNTSKSLSRFSDYVTRDGNRHAKKSQDTGMWLGICVDIVDDARSYAFWHISPEYISAGPVWRSNFFSFVPPSKPALNLPLTTLESGANEPLRRVIPLRMNHFQPCKFLSSLTNPLFWIKHRQVYDDYCNLCRTNKVFI